MDWREAEGKIVSQSVRSRDEAVPQVTEARLSLWDVVYALNILLRLADTVVGIAIGVACKWAGSFLLHRFGGETAP